MLKRLAGPLAMIAAMMAGSPLAHAQTAKAAPAASDIPKRDISGTWTPARANSGNGGMGPASAPSDGRHEPPFTQLALDTMKLYHPGNGVYQVVPSRINDPAVIFCDPQGVPRMDVYEFRDLHIVQERLKVYLLYQYEKVWRTIWTDGRKLPENPDIQRWMGYSVGKWTDDYTFVAETTNVDERTWLDKTGRPHSDEMRVEETFHRTGRDTLDLTVEIFDAKMYKAPWKPLDKFPMKLLPEDFDSNEMMCSVSEYMEYNKRMGFGQPTSTNGPPPVPPQ